MKCPEASMNPPFHDLTARTPWKVRTYLATSEVRSLSGEADVHGLPLQGRSAKYLL